MRIAVVQQVPRRLVFGKGAAEVLDRPCRRGMVGDADVNDPSPVVRENEEHEQQTTRSRRDDEEIGGYDLLDVIGQEGAPGLRGQYGWAGKILRHCCLRDLHSELQELAVYPWGGPTTDWPATSSESAHVYQPTQWVCRCVADFSTPRTSGSLGDATR
jgi:hypothetical protein